MLLVVLMLHVNASALYIINAESPLLLISRPASVKLSILYQHASISCGYVLSLKLQKW